MRTGAKLDREIAAIGDLPRDELIARWTKQFGNPPSRSLQRPFLERVLTWEIQARHLGGLSRVARQALKAPRRVARTSTDLTGEMSSTDAADGDSDTSAPIDHKGGDRVDPGSRSGETTVATGPEKMPTMVRLTPGMRLLREWNGRMHVVDITDDGILFDGKKYRSLTAVAARITGSKWSGPRFFNLAQAGRT